MKNDRCGYCDQPQGAMYDPDAEYHECTECQQQIGRTVCEENQGLCSECAMPLGKMD